MSEPSLADGKRLLKIDLETIGTFNLAKDKPSHYAAQFEAAYCI
jgi:hypothetical protein